MAFVNHDDIEESGRVIALEEILHRMFRACAFLGLMVEGLVGGDEDTGVFLRIAGAHLGGVGAECGKEIAEAVFARCLSAVKEERVAASKILKGPSKKYRGSNQKRTLYS